VISLGFISTPSLPAHSHFTLALNGCYGLDMVGVCPWELILSVVMVGGGRTFKRRSKRQGPWVTGHGFLGELSSSPGTLVSSESESLSEIEPGPSLLSGFLSHQVISPCHSLLPRGGEVLARTRMLLRNLDSKTMS
jgi:hypothetical protein